MFSEGTEWEPVTTIVLHKSSYCVSPKSKSHNHCLKAAESVLPPGHKKWTELT